MKKAKIVNYQPVLSFNFRSKDGLFELVWQDDGSVTFKAHNDKFVGTKKSGHLFANCDAMDENTKYYFYLINRPVLVLKCDQGFVGYKSSSSTRLECNKATYETIVVERTDKGMVHLKGTYVSIYIKYFQRFFFVISYLVYISQWCGNCGNLLLRNFHKHFVKETFLLKK